VSASFTSRLTHNTVGHFEDEGPCATQVRHGSGVACINGSKAIRSGHRSKIPDPLPSLDYITDKKKATESAYLARQDDDADDEDDDEDDRDTVERGTAGFGRHRGLL